ncbi:hypothetical protein K0M31_015880 [Melipona bicolor]|uniref:Uncharacterized protein n=1 Tax=Melipona bicolor TaxID=60889 RepID=A0AA40G5X4_9HYME|nr:hypothetical protein K0M31_015880 [Melipona bicolor]
MVRKGQSLAGIGFRASSLVGVRSGYEEVKRDTSFSSFSQRASVFSLSCEEWLAQWETGLGNMLTVELRDWRWTVRRVSSVRGAFDAELEGPTSAVA